MQTEMEQENVEKDKKRSEITPDVEPLPKKVEEDPETSDTQTPSIKVEMAEFFPEPNFLVGIPVKMIETLYNLKSSLKDSKTPKETQKLINEAKSQCLKHATRENPQTSKIIDDTKKLEKLMESVKVRRKYAECPALDAARKRAYEASVEVCKEGAKKFKSEKRS